MKYIISILIVLLGSFQRPTRVVFLGDSITEMADNKEGEGIYAGFITSLRNTFEDRDIELINKNLIQKKRLKYKKLIGNAKLEKIEFSR